jgi:Xaa-Pro aminopeptidase
MTRIDNLRAAFSIEKNECAVITSDKNRAYFTGFADTDGFLLIFSDSAVMLSDSRYFEAAKAEAENVDVVLLKRQFAQLREILDERAVNTIFLEQDYVTLAQYALFSEKFSNQTTVGSKELSGAIKKLRQIKSADEIALIKTAQRIAEKSLTELLPEIKPGKTEREIAAKLNFLMQKNGSDGPSFDTIVLTGKNTSKPHGVPSDAKVQTGDFVLIDFGATKGGYHSDMTRTLTIGEVSEKKRNVYETVKEAQNRAFARIAPGKTCKEIDAAARDFIDAAGFGESFGHGLGHSVGLDIHETPSFNKSAEDVLRPGMVLTVEPGIYLENEFGVRIEDIAVITENGFENITKFNKYLNLYVYSINFRNTT